MTEIERLRAENASLKANATVHQTLKEIYGNPAEPTSNRIRRRRRAARRSVSARIRRAGADCQAATAALACETPSLKPQQPVLDLTAVEHESLAETVERQRRRADRILALPLEQRAALFVGVGNGDDSGGNGTVSGI
jgi:hypothetical protein